MEHSHLSQETLARWLAGRLEHEAVLSEVVPHFLSNCTVCRDRVAEIRKLQEEVGHWDEEVAVIEGQEAPELLRRIEDQPFAEQARRAEQDDALHTWGLCHLLLKKSLDRISDEPARALDLADLAVRISRHLGEAYHPAWVLGLRARAFAYLANARRVLGELRSSEAAFRKAEACLDRSGLGDPGTEAEILDMKSSLRREALELSDRALALYREARDTHGVGIGLLKKGKILEEAGDLGPAEWLQQSAAEIDASGDPRLSTSLRYNLVGCLTLAGRHSEAERLLPEVRSLFQETAQPLDWVRLRWAEGSIACGLGRTGEAEPAFREVQREFLDRGMDYNAALVALDLAGLLAHEGRTAELKSLAAELLQAFEMREIYREAAAVFLLFRQACEEERFTNELARHLASLLRERRRDR